VEKACIGIWVWCGALRAGAYISGDLVGRIPNTFLFPSRFPDLRKRTKEILDRVLFGFSNLAGAFGTEQGRSYL
jgi:hypothetical protein